MTARTTTPRSAAERGPRTASGRALHDWWHQIGLLMLDAAQDHEHPEGCNFLSMVLAIEAEAGATTGVPLDVERLAALLHAVEDPDIGEGPSLRQRQKAEAIIARLSAGEGGTT